MSKYSHVTFLLVIATVFQTGVLVLSSNATADSSSDGVIRDVATTTQAIDLNRWRRLENIIPNLAQQRVVFLGEEHTRLDHHLNQLAIIRHLHAIHPNLVIGVEYFQQPYQDNLDEFIEGKIDTTELLVRTQYYRRWGYSFRLYAPIFQFAQEHHIPVIALNAPKEITDQVARVGLDGLNSQQRAALPEHIDTSNSAYRKHLAQIYQEHPAVGERDFEKFYEVQLVWDESMAARAARYLQQHPDRPMVVLAGQGHLAYGYGIPDRLVRRVDVSSAIVLNDWQGAVSPDLANFLLVSPEMKLPTTGILGVILGGEDEQNGGALVKSLVPASAAELAGIKRGDQIIALDTIPVSGAADVKARLWNKKPGDRVWVKVRRRKWFQSDDELRFAVTLGRSQ